MMEAEYKTLGLTPGCTFSDVKKAWRKLARQRHPDRYPEGAQREAQSEEMARLNAAYEALAQYFRSRKREIRPETDFDIYRRAASLWAPMKGYLALRFRNIVLDLSRLQAMQADLEAAKAGFEKLLLLYPESGFAGDARDKLALITESEANLRASIEMVRTHTLGRTAKGTPQWKKK